MLNVARAVPTKECMLMVTEAKSVIGGIEQGAFGKRIMELADRLAQWSETADGLTCTYLSPAHRVGRRRHCAIWMRAAGLTTEIDGVGKRRRAATPPPIQPRRTLIIASHYDTVRNAGNYDGRLGILTASWLVEHLQPAGPPAAVSSRRHRLFGRGGRALLRSAFSAAAPWPAASTCACCSGATPAARALADVMHEAGFDPEAIPVARAPPRGSVGLSRGAHRARPGAAAGEACRSGSSARSRARSATSVTITGMAGHAGTVPMARRHDAAAAAAEIVLYVERAARRRRRWSARSASLPCPAARSTSFPAAAISRSTFAPPTTPPATPRSPTSGRDRAHRGKRRKVTDREQGDAAQPRPCLARRACSRCSPPP